MKYNINGEPLTRAYKTIKRALNDCSIPYLEGVVDVLGDLPLQEDERENGLAYMSLAAKYLLVPKLDLELIKLLGHRGNISRQIGSIKKEKGLPIYVPEREREVIATRERMALGLGLPSGLATELWTLIMAESRRVQEAL